MKKVKKIIILFFYYLAKITAKKGFWFLYMVLFYFWGFNKWHIIFDYYALLKLFITFIVFFEIYYFVFLKKQLQGMKKSEQDFREILDKWGK